MSIWLIKYKHFRKYAKIYTILNTLVSRILAVEFILHRETEIKLLVESINYNYNAVSNFLLDKSRRFNTRRKECVRKLISFANGNVILVSEEVGSTVYIFRPQTSKFFPGGPSSGHFRLCIAQIFHFFGWQMRNETSDGKSYKFSRICNWGRNCSFILLRCPRISSKSHKSFFLSTKELLYNLLYFINTLLRLFVIVILIDYITNKY